MHSKEEKIADGIYITRYVKPDDIKQSYVYRTTTELIKLLESDFEQIVMEVEMLYNANEEMLEYDPSDYDLIQAREDNLAIINKRLERLKEIQKELMHVCPTNPFVKIDIFEYFNKSVETTTKSEEIIREIEL
jgi:hypothetical protein